MADAVSFALHSSRAAEQDGRMPVWLQYTLTMVALVAVVPLFVWANTGRLSSAWYALKRYLLCMAILAAPGAVFTLVYWLLQ
jgi:hypothetical protein